MRSCLTVGSHLQRFEFESMNYRFKKWTRWEYWPWWLANIPVYAYYLWFAIRSRHLFFFSNVNPSIPLGGAMGESKWDILQLLPQVLVPETVFVPAGTGSGQALEWMKNAEMEFPVVVKPNVGERGFLIRIIQDEEALKKHLDDHKLDLLIQKMLTEPFEATVSYYLFPDGRFGIGSMCVKEFLTVTGDGKHSIAQLMEDDLRAGLQLDRLLKSDPGLLQRVPDQGEQVLIEPVGNHARGTKFLNGLHLIDQRLIDVFQPICASIDGVYFARFDLKADSMDSLREGKFSVMELNGVLGEPAHIYDPDYGARRAYRDLYRHWKTIFELHKALKKEGISPPGHREAFRMVRAYFRYKKAASAS